MTGWETWARRLGRVAMVPMLCVAGLAMAGPAGATTSPPTADPGFIGTWQNVDSSTLDLAQVVITSDGAGGLLVDVFGECHPDLCEYGQAAATIYAPPGSTAPGRSFQVVEDSGFEHVVLQGQLSGGPHSPRLTIDQFHDFTDGSGRPNFVSSNRFAPAAPGSTTTAATLATDYPAGDSLRPLNGFVGDWHNTAADPQGILELDITRAGDGSLLVHEFGACTPTPCDNGTASSISFGGNPLAHNGSKVLVPFEYSFQRELDTMSLSGHTLKVVERFEFTDGSGRPNIINTETFTR